MLVSFLGVSYTGGKGWKQSRTGCTRVTFARKVGEELIFQDRRYEEKRADMASSMQEVYAFTWTWMRRKSGDKSADQKRRIFLRGCVSIWRGSLFDENASKRDTNERSSVRLTPWISRWKFIDVGSTFHPHFHAHVSVSIIRRIRKFLEWNFVLNFQKIPNPAKQISIKRLVHKDFGIVDRSRKKIANRLWIFDEPTTAKMDAHISRPRAIGFRLRRLINSPDWNNSAVRIAAVESY